MKNYNKIKNLIKNSIDLLPLDIDNKYAKNYLENALFEINKIEKRSEKRKSKTNMPFVSLRAEETIKKSLGKDQMAFAKSRIEEINLLIKKEKEKLLNNNETQGDLINE